MPRYYMKYPRVLYYFLISHKYFLWNSRNRETKEIESVYNENQVRYCQFVNS